MLDMEEAKDAEPMLIISDDEDEPQSAIVPVKRRRSMDDGIHCYVVKVSLEILEI